MSNLREALATQLGKFRRERGWTQEQLAAECGRSAGWVRGYEQQTRWPDPEDLELLANALGIQSVDLLIIEETEVPLDTATIRLSNNLREARKRHGLTQEALAEKLGITSESVQNWENGRRFPRGKSLVDLCRILNLDPSVLLAPSPTSETTEIENKVNRFLELIRRISHLDPIADHIMIEGLYDQSDRRQWTV